MFPDLTGSLDTLSPEQRYALEELVELNIQYSHHLATLGGMKIEYLKDPNSDRKRQMEGFDRDYVEPLLKRINIKRRELIEKSIDVDSLKETLPMVVLALTRSINIPLLMETLGINPIMVKEIMGDLQDFLSKDM